MTGRSAGTDVDADTLLKIVLVLAVVWLALEILGEVLDVLAGVLISLPKLLGVVLIVLVVLSLLDRI